MHPAIAQHSSGISAIRQRYRISQMEVFGSAAGADNFNPIWIRFSTPRPIFDTFLAVPAGVALKLEPWFS
jgi:predicted nucleotidyltransferase